MRPTLLYTAAAIAWLVALHRETVRARLRAAFDEWWHDIEEAAAQVTISTDTADLALEALRQTTSSPPPPPMPPRRISSSGDSATGMTIAELLDTTLEASSE